MSPLGLWRHRSRCRSIREFQDCLLTCNLLLLESQHPVVVTKHFSFSNRFMHAENKSGYYRKLGDPSVDTRCCLFTLGRYRYESTWYSIAHCCVPHSTKWKAFGNLKQFSPGNVKRGWLYRCTVLINKCLSFRRETLHLNNPFQTKIQSSISVLSFKSIHMDSDIFKYSYL